MAKTTTKAEAKTTETDEALREIHISLDDLWTHCQRFGLGPDSRAGQSYEKARAALAKLAPTE